MGGEHLRGLPWGGGGGTAGIITAGRGRYSTTGTAATGTAGQELVSEPGSRAGLDSEHAGQLLSRSQSVPSFVPSSCRDRSHTCRGNDFGRSRERSRENAIYRKGLGTFPGTDPDRMLGTLWERWELTPFCRVTTRNGGKLGPVVTPPHTICVRDART